MLYTSLQHHDIIGLHHPYYAHSKGGGTKNKSIWLLESFFIGMPVEMMIQQIQDFSGLYVNTQDVFIDNYS